MISKLPRWVEFGGFLLAAIAGCVNAIGLLGFSHQAVSHLTGTLTILAFELVNVDGNQSLHLALILLSFLFGAAFSGFLIENTSLQLRRRYGFALIVEALLLFMAMVFLNQGSDVGHYFASMACGLQNAMVSTFSGAIVRTTHVTGIFTDLGIMIGNRFRGLAFDKRKAILFVTLITGFLCGGSLGTMTFNAYQFNALMLPICMALGLAATYWSFLYFYKAK